jgi:hypothetical protein
MNIYKVEEKQMGNGSWTFNCSDSCKEKNIRVLIISDRLMDRARALADYLSSESVDVVGLAQDRHQTMEIAQKSSFDYLIIAGYLKTQYTYGVIEELRKQRRSFLAVQWAMLDSLINGFCLSYKIPLKFERTLPLEEFVRFLKIHRNDPIPCFTEEVAGPVEEPDSNSHGLEFLKNCSDQLKIYADRLQNWWDKQL